MQNRTNYINAEINVLNSDTNRYNMVIGDYEGTKTKHLFLNREQLLRVKEVLVKPYGNLTIVGRRWFQKLYGNTYHSVVVYVDGKCIGYKNYVYGHGNMYLNTGMKILNENGYSIPRDEAFNEYNLFASVTEVVTDVSKKSELSFVVYTG